MWSVQLISPSNETVALKPVQLQANNHQFDLPVVLVIHRASCWFNVGSLKAHLWDGKYCHHATDREDYPTRKEQCTLRCPISQYVLLRSVFWSSTPTLLSFNDRPLYFRFHSDFRFCSDFFFFPYLFILLPSSGPLELYVSLGRSVGAQPSMLPICSLRAYRCQQAVL